MEITHLFRVKEENKEMQKMSSRRKSAPQEKEEKGVPCTQGPLREQKGTARKSKVF